MHVFRRAVVIVATAASLAAAQQTPAPTAAAAGGLSPQRPLDRIFIRLYNFDFPAAQSLLAEYTKDHADDPLGWSVRAVTYLFVELDRMRILQTDFFMDDDTIVEDRGKPEPDPEVKKKLLAAVEEARRRAQARIAEHPNDRDALLAFCMAANVVTDYTTLVERRRWQGIGLARQSVAYANKLLSLDPPVYDAYNTTGAVEYIVGSMPFFVRWFVHYDKIDGNKRKGIENLKLVARHGRFYAPFARVLLAVISLRENKLEDARQLLAGLSSEFPENALFRRELGHVTDRIAREAAKRRGRPPSVSSHRTQHPAPSTQLHRRVPAPQNHRCAFPATPVPPADVTAPSACARRL